MDQWTLELRSFSKRRMMPALAPVLVTVESAPMTFTSGMALASFEDSNSTSASQIVHAFLSSVVTCPRYLSPGSLKATLACCLNLRLARRITCRSTTQDLSLGVMIPKSINAALTTAAAPRPCSSTLSAWPRALRWGGTSSSSWLEEKCWLN